MILIPRSICTGLGILNAVPDLLLFSRAWDPLKVSDQGALQMEDNSGWGLDKG